MHDQRAGRVLRALRRRRGLTQSDVAAAAGVSQAAISRAERGHFDALSLRITRRIFAALDALPELDIRWRGGEIDRILDEGHARLVASVAGELRRLGWKVFVEVTYSIYGERGSVDLLAVDESRRAAAVMEIKTEITSAEETARRFDAKCRLAPRLVRDRIGWMPVTLGRVFVVAGTRSNRRRVDSLATLFRDAYPARSREVARWLRDPSGDFGGMWFVSSTHRGSGSPGCGGPKRVRRRRHAPATSAIERSGG